MQFGQLSRGRDGHRPVPPAPEHARKPGALHEVAADKKSGNLAVGALPRLDANRRKKLAPPDSMP